MKNQSRIITAVVLMLVVLAVPAWAQSRVATVDLRKLFDGYWKTKEAENALKERAADFTKESNNLRDDYKKSGDEYKKLLADSNDQAVSSEEREKRKQAAEAKLKDLKQAEDTIAQFERQARTSIDDQKKRMRDKVLDEIRAVVKARAKSSGYDVVLDVAGESANGTAVVLYNNGENDITEAVLTQLNTSAPLDLKRPDETKDAKPAK